MSVIIFEGIDNSGKSTQIKLIKTMLRLNGHSVDIFACNSTTKFIDIQRVILNYQNSNNILLLDRSHFGELPYGVSYFNKDKQQIINKIKEFEDNIDINDVVVILFTTEYDRGIESSWYREDGKSIGKAYMNYGEFYDLTKIEINLFNEVFDISKIKHKYKIDFYNKSIEDITNLVTNKINKLYSYNNNVLSKDKTVSEMNSIFDF